MRSMKKLISAVLAMGIACMSAGITAFPVSAATTVTLSPSDRYEINGGVFEG